MYWREFGIWESFSNDAAARGKQRNDLVCGVLFESSRHRKLHYKKVWMHWANNYRSTH